MKIFKLPDLGEGLPDAIIREWYVHEGDKIEKDQPMVAMETAKALVDIPAPYAGTVEKLFGSVGDTIDTGNPLIGFVGAGSQEKTSDAGTVVGNLEVSDTIYEGEMHLSTARKSTTTAKATPAVKMLAKQLGVDLQTLAAQGAQITAEDVKRAANLSPQPARRIQLTGELTKLSPVRKAMALSMMQSHQEIVPATIMGDANLQRWDAQQDITLRIIRAMQKACEQWPLLNAYYDSQQMAYQLNETINLGIAVDTQQGLFVPVLKDIAQQEDRSLREKINLFKQQAESRSFPQEELQGATIVMSNVGAIAGSYAAPIITPPMVAIVAFGRTKQQVVLNGDRVESHRMLPISITFDHRPVTGGDAARFLKTLIAELEHGALSG